MLLAIEEVAHVFGGRHDELGRRNRAVLELDDEDGIVVGTGAADRCRQGEDGREKGRNQPAHLNTRPSCRCR